MSSLLTRIAVCTTRTAKINKVSSSKKNLLVLFKGSQWETGLQICYISNYFGIDTAEDGTTSTKAEVNMEVALPKKFSMIQCTTEDGEPMFTKDNQPVMKFDYMIEE